MTTYVCSMILWSFSTSMRLQNGNYMIHSGSDSASPNIAMHDRKDVVRTWDTRFGPRPEVSGIRRPSVT
jgi:hypothetical protein